mmetsp:Transcript_7333/g.10392  ORF Transcript_7333/g.10392 Transcript_7333/m.10392 type:complete len:155 (+) Transcript_7333:261-725(+)
MKITLSSLFLASMAIMVTADEKHNNNNNGIHRRRRHRRAATNHHVVIEDVNQQQQQSTKREKSSFLESEIDSKSAELDLNVERFMMMSMSMSMMPSNCDHVCKGSYPYGCVDWNMDNIVAYQCAPDPGNNQVGGCNYLAQGETGHDGWCTYKTA